MNCQKCDGRGWHPALTCKHNGDDAEACSSCYADWPLGDSSFEVEMFCNCSAGQQRKTRETT